MSETLTSRVGRLIAGSFHALVDAVENAAPENIMEQAIREIDGATGDVRNDLGTIEVQRHLTAKRLAEESSRHEQLAEQASLAVDQGRDDLATAAIERQIDIEAQLPVLEARLAELADDKTRLEGYVSALQAKRREMRDALADYRKTAERTNAATTDTGGNAAGRAHDRAERATDAFERVFQRHTGLGLATGGTARSTAQLAELEELARSNRVQERIARLKAKP